MNREQILDVVKKNVFDVVDGLAVGDYRPQATLNEMGADSLQIVEILSLCMRELRIKVPQSEFARAKTPEQIADLFVSNQARK